MKIFFYINKFTAIILQDKTAIHAFEKLPKMKTCSFVLSYIKRSWIGPDKRSPTHLVSNNEAIIVSRKKSIKPRIPFFLITLIKLSEN